MGEAGMGEPGVAGLEATGVVAILLAGAGVTGFGNTGVAGWACGVAGLRIGFVGGTGECGGKLWFGGGGLWKGVNFRKNFLFRRVTRPDPSTFTWYWSYVLASTIRPVLSHLLGLFPVWFWM